ncbi:MAG: thioredoxin [bacterium]|nr:thioredoxin [bacterium]
MAIVLTDENFDREVIESNVPVLVDFWASWCSPCGMMAPVIEEVASEYKGKIKVCKLDVDSNPKKSGEYKIRSIPTLLIFRDGKVTESLVGYQPKQVLIDKLDALLKME